MDRDKAIFWLTTLLFLNIDIFGILLTIDGLYCAKNELSEICSVVEPAARFYGVERIEERSFSEVKVDEQ